MPTSEFKTFLSQNQALLERYSVEPDSKLKRLYGQAEQRRHYIDIDFYGPDGFSQLNPSLVATEAKFGTANVERWGTLPWTIEEYAAALGRQLSYHGSGDSHDCARILVLAGYLSHYVGDSTQPLHATRYFDGFSRDRGIHHRVEDATDHEVGNLEAIAHSTPEMRSIDSVWGSVIAELRHSHTLVMPLINADRAARAHSYGNFSSYERELMRYDGSMIAVQIQRAASLLASIWLYEWDRAGRPEVCKTSRTLEPHRKSAW